MNLALKLITNSFKGLSQLSDIELGDSKFIILIDLQQDFNPLHATGLFLYHQEPLENQRFFDVFRGYRKRSMLKWVNNIDQEILLRKTKFIGFSEKVVELFNIYFTEREFSGSLENVLSNRDTMECNAPRGITLGHF